MNALEISEKDFLTGARQGIRKSRLLSIALHVQIKLILHGRVEILHI